MPNYADLEMQVLDRQQADLCRASRQPSLGALTDAAVLDLVDRLETARQQAETSSLDGLPAAADLLGTALRRAQAERRKRKLKPGQPVPPDTGLTHTIAETGKTAARVKSGQHVPAAGNRKPAGRKAEHRKADLRTGPHRVVKNKKKPAADAPSSTVVADPPLSHLVAASPSPDDDAARRKAVRKAERLAAKVAEKQQQAVARRAEREDARAAAKAAKQAVKAAEKAADKASKRAQRQQERQAALADGTFVEARPGKGKNKSEAKRGKGGHKKPDNPGAEG